MISSNFDEIIMLTIIEEKTNTILCWKICKNKLNRNVKPEYTGKIPATGLAPVNFVDPFFFILGGISVWFILAEASVAEVSVNIFPQFCRLEIFFSLSFLVPALIGCPICILVVT